MARPKSKVELPTILTKDCWFYEDNKELCDPHLGKPYISYSTVNSWEEYRDDFIKNKFAGIETPDNVYADLGSYIGSAVETGEWPEENPHGFIGQENFQDILDDRPSTAIYERMILLDMGEYVIIGFIDIFNMYKEGDESLAQVVDLKSGGKGKEDYYSSEEYIQVMLYAKALEKEGIKVGDTSILFVRREGSHVKPPLKISDERFVIQLEYTEDRVKYALDKVDRVVKEISSCFKTYNKIFA